jgi:hypothetical protein
MAVQFPPFRIGEESAAPGTISESRVRAVLAGKDASFTREQVLTLVLASTLPDKMELIRSVLEDDRASPGARRAAAIALGRLDLPESRKALIRALAQTDRQVLCGAVKALGWIGGPEAYEPLLHLRNHADQTVVALAEFSARLIAHRNGLPGTELPPLKMSPRLDLSPDSQRPIDIMPASDERARRCLRSIATRSFGIEVDKKHLHEMRCLKSEWMLVFDRRFIEKPSAFLRRRSIPCATAVWTEEHGSYSIAAVGLFEPEVPGVAGGLRFCRSMGEPVFDGSLRIESDRVQFGVYAVVRPGAFPVVFEGVLDRVGMNVRKALSSPIGIPKRRPIPFPLH